MNPTNPLKITGIDTHAHIFRTDLPLVNNHRYAPEYNALGEAFIRQFEQHGLSHGVLIQPSFLGTDNHFMLEALKAHPNKLKGIAVVDPNISDTMLEELDDAGVVGIRLNLIEKTLEDYSTPLWQGFFRKLEKKVGKLKYKEE